MEHNNDYGTTLIFTAKNKDAINELKDMALSTGASIQTLNALKQGFYGIKVETWESRAEEILAFAEQQNVTCEQEWGAHQVVINYGDGAETKANYRTIEQAKQAICDEFLYNCAQSAGIYNKENLDIELFCGYSSPEKLFAEEVIEKNGGADAIKENPLPFKFPTITCEWSESVVFDEKRVYTVTDFDRIMKETDANHVANHNYYMQKYGNFDNWCDAGEHSEYMGYDKTKFHVNMPNGDTYIERQDIGDGDGGVIDFLKKYPAFNEIIPELEQERDKERVIARNIHFGELGNGITCYDVSRTVNGDYPMVAHISNEGEVKFYEDLTRAEKKLINVEARQQKSEFKKEWEKTPIEKRFETILNRANDEQISLITSDNALSMKEKVEKYEHCVIFKDAPTPSLDSDYDFKQFVDMSDKRYGTDFQNGEVIATAKLDKYNLSVSLVYDLYNDFTIVPEINGVDATQNKDLFRAGIEKKHYNVYGEPAENVKKNLIAALDVFKYQIDDCIINDLIDTRLYFAQNGVALHKLAYDDEPIVRLEVAKNGGELDKLSTDTDWVIRREVVRACDINNPAHREILDRLINDTSVNVCCEIIKKGYGLDAFSNHDNKIVRDAVKDYKEKHPDWDKKQPDKAKDTVSRED